MNTNYPFGAAFGSVTSRNECIECIEIIYESLLLGDQYDDFTLSFKTIAGLAVRNEHLDEDLLEDLIKLFRPDRDGTLSLVDFAKSVDTVYKELRLLRASVATSTKVRRK